MKEIDQLLDAERLLRELERPRREFLALIEVDVATWQRWKNGQSAHLSSWRRFENGYARLQRDAAANAVSPRAARQATGT